MKKALALLTVLILMASLIVGCSAPAATEAPAEQPAEAAQQASAEGSDAAEQTAAEGAFDPNKQYEITIWQHQTSDMRVAAWEKTVAAFVQEYPNVKVNLEYTSWEDNPTKFINGIETGTCADIVEFTETTWTTAYDVKGLVVADDLVERIDKEVGLFDGSQSGFYKDGHYYGVTYCTVGEQLFYRPSMLKAAGIEQPPKTWAEFVECAKQLTVDKDGDGVIDQFGVGLAYSRHDVTENTYAAFMGTTGADVFDEKGNINFNTPEQVATLQLYKDLAPYAPEGASSWQWGEIEQNWAAGTFAMFPYPSPNLLGFLENKDYDIAAAPLPSPDGSNKSHIAMNFILGITTDSAKRGSQPAAEKFVEFVARPEWNYVMTVCQDPGLFFPTTEACSELINSGYFDEANFPLSKDIYDNTEGSETRTIFETIAASASATVSVGYAFGHKYGPINTDFSSFYGAMIFADMVQKCIIENIPAEECVAWAQSAMEDMATN